MAYVGYFIFFSLGKALALLPLRILYFISDFLYLIIYHIIKYRKKVVFENLRNAFPEKTEKEIEQIAKKFYRHLCDVFIEILKMMHVSKSEMKRRIKLRNPEVIEAAYANNKHIFAVIAHYGNWEWGTALGMYGKHNFVSIYRPLTNKHFDQLMINLRTQFGGEVVPMRLTARVITQYIKENKPSIYCFISDQSPYHSEAQYFTNFFNQDTAVNLGVEKLARAAKQPVYFAKMIKVKRGYYETEVIKLCDDCSTTAVHEITDKHVQMLESVIREHPEYWLWTHRRWKVKRPQS